MNSSAMLMGPYQSFLTSLQGLWYQLGLYVPRLVGALVILIIGLIVASVLASIVKNVIRYTKVDGLFDNLEARAHLEKMGIKFTLSSVLAWFVKWFVIIATLITVADTLGLTQITLFLQQVVLYIPNIIVAVAILTIGLIAGEFLSKVVADMLKTSSLTSQNASTMGRLSKYAVIVFAFMAALIQLGIAPQLIEILFAGLVLTLTLAFGLGGREQAAKLLEKLSNNQQK